MPLSDRDKTPAPHGYGVHFHHTEPQRLVPCVLGDMLAPRSADDIPPITPAAMESVQAALKLLADLIGDRDLGRFLGDNADDNVQVSRDVLLTARGLAGILRVESEAVGKTKRLAEEFASSLSDDQGKAIVSRLDEKQEAAFKAVFKDALDAAATCDQQAARQEAFAHKVLAEQEAEADRVDRRRQVAGLVQEAIDASTSVELRVCLTKAELRALRQADVHLAHQHSWEVRDTAMGAIGKVLDAAREGSS